MTSISFRAKHKKWIAPILQIAILSLWLLLSFLWLLPFLSTEANDFTSIRTVLSWNDHSTDPSFAPEYQYTKGTFCATASSCRLSFPQEKGKDRYIRSSETSHIVTQKGVKMGLPNQDRCLVVESDQMTLAALFDGHGENGHFVSDRALRDLPFRLLESGSANAAQAIRESFLETDASPNIQEVIDGGTSAVIAWRIGTKVYLASAGDSTGMLVHYQGGKSKVILEAVKHKPADPLERARIEAAGGMVSVPEAKELSSRVVYKTRQGEMALAMSRCIGDVDGKGPGYLIAEPSIVMQDLSSVPGDRDSFFFFVVASDGLIDEVSKKDLLAKLGNVLNKGVGLRKIVNQLLNEAARSWSIKMMGTYRDDMSIVVTRLKI